VVVGSREDAQVIGSSNGSSVLRSNVSDSSRVAGDSSLLDIVTSRGTCQEAVLTDHSIDVGGWALEEVEESTAVEVGLLEVQVELCALVLAGREERAQDLGLESLGDRVVELNLGVESIDSVPCLGERKAGWLVCVLGLKL